MRGHGKVSEQKRLEKEGGKNHYLLQKFILGEKSRPAELKIL